LPVVTFAGSLCLDRPVDLPLVMLAGARFPDGAFQVIWPHPGSWSSLVSHSPDFSLDHGCLLVAPGQSENLRLIG
jgi:hypothetical protein